MPKPELVLDFETEAIGPRPKEYPPKPVGYAFIFDNSKNYVSWGHPSDNSHTYKDAHAKLTWLVNNASCIIAHNHGFDKEVMWEHMGIAHNVWHDTMFLAFLHNPYGDMALKPVAHKVLGIPPEEQNKLKDWLINNRIIRPNQKDWGAYICKAPASIVKPYAIGDCIRTQKLFKLWRNITQTEAYKREMQFTPIVTEMEQLGVHIDKKKLAKDVDFYFNLLDNEDKKISKALGGADLDADQEVARQLEACGKLAAPLPLTEKGAISVNKRALMDCVKDRKLVGQMLMRNGLATALRTFMVPWLYNSKGDTLYFKFNQIRNEGAVGARTGRMSSSPNMMNVPDVWEALNGLLSQLKGFKPSYTLPNVRSYIIPDNEDSVICSIDYNQQEMRLFAYFEDGALAAEYNKNPNIDAHQMVAELSGLSRKAAKTLNFAELYGAGLGVIMERMDCLESEARMFKRQYSSALPGVNDLKKTINSLVSNGSPIVTIGGREYYVEEPKIIKGRLRDFKYKLLNYLIQGSASDQIKQAIIDYYNGGPIAHLLFTVHDETVLSISKKRIKTETSLLSKSMQNAFANELGIPFTTSIKIGPNYGNLKEI